MISIVNLRSSSSEQPNIHIQPNAAQVLLDYRRANLPSDNEHLKLAHEFNRHPLTESERREHFERAVLLDRHQAIELKKERAEEAHRADQLRSKPAEQARRSVQTITPSLGLNHRVDSGYKYAHSPPPLLFAETQWEKGMPMTVVPVATANVFFLHLAKH